VLILLAVNDCCLRSFAEQKSNNTKSNIHRLIDSINLRATCAITRARHIRERQRGNTHDKNTRRWKDTINSHGIMLIHSILGKDGHNASLQRIQWKLNFRRTRRHDKRVCHHAQLLVIARNAAATALASSMFPSSLSSSSSGLRCREPERTRLCRLLSTFSMRALFMRSK